MVWIITGLFYEVFEHLFEVVREYPADVLRLVPQGFVHPRAGFDESASARPVPVVDERGVFAEVTETAFERFEFRLVGIAERSSIHRSPPFGSPLDGEDRLLDGSVERLLNLQRPDGFEEFLYVGRVDVKTHFPFW